MPITPNEGADGGVVELSVVMPCLNEARTLERCIRTAQAALERHNVAGEVIVADNGSTDGSRDIAERLGARVVTVSTRGYGSALRGGIEAARGRYVLMGDGDDSYDFGELSRFLGPLRQGYDLVMGNRFHGAILPGAMPWKNRYLGNPALSATGRLFFRSNCGDFHCGLRAFRRTAYREMELDTPGMEFASEMVIRATLRGLRITEVPVTLRPDGRLGRSHLRPWRDGWLHLRLMLLYSPRWLFFCPGVAALGLGLLVLLLTSLQGPLLGGDAVAAGLWGAACLLVVAGMNAMGLSLLGKQFTIQQGLHPPNQRLDRFLRHFNMEWGIVAGLVLASMAVAGPALAIFLRQEHPGDPARALRWEWPCACLGLLGIQTFLLACFSSLMNLRRR